MLPEVSNRTFEVEELGVLSISSVKVVLLVISL